MTVSPNTPILIGTGQVISHWGGDDPKLALSPAKLQAAAAAAALQDTGAAEGVRGAVDQVVVVRTMADSVPGAPHPFGRCANLPATLAASLGLTPKRATYSVVGGDQPQALVNEAAEGIFAGNAQMVLLAGSEATAAMKLALKRRVTLDWSDGVDGEMEDRGLGQRLLSNYEIANGLGQPIQTYPAFEHALRARLGASRAEHRALMSELWATFSKVAESHPFAQYPQARSADFLSALGPDNYQISDPYLKWDVAQDAVNQGAAVIMTSVGQATALGVDPAKWVYLHGYAKAADRLPTERADLSRSLAMELSLARALEAAGKTAADIGIFDLYSCFPCAVLIATEALGLDWRKTPATVTGGLPFFGGAGNNYSMHAIATMVERLRAEPTAFGLVLANGGFLSKEAVGIYSAVPKEDWRPVSSADLQKTIDDATAPPLLEETTEGVIRTYTVTSRKGQPDRAYVIAETPKGRILARAESGHRATMTALLGDPDPIGQKVHIVHRGGVNLICARGAIGAATDGGFLSRSFKYVLVERHGHVLEVTLNRPESFNSLHSAAHFELHEIWDAFEADPDLWVAIVTGAGDRAFCSGNDLKATARGADMSTPRSGFGGLCSRFDREKPIIAAVNGVAMGGGLEIALACDLVVAAESAKVALPEVKVGLYAAAGRVQRLTRQIGRKAAMDLILTGRHILAPEALSLGIINRLAPDGGAMEAARELAQTLLANSPSAIRASKQALNKLEEIECLKAALEANNPIIGRLMRTKDLREGVTAFAEKRTPNWTNS